MNLFLYSFAGIDNFVCRIDKSIIPLNCASLRRTLLGDNNKISDIHLFYSRVFCLEKAIVQLALLLFTPFFFVHYPSKVLSYLSFSLLIKQLLVIQLIDSFTSDKTNLRITWSCLTVLGGKVDASFIHYRQQYHLKVKPSYGL